MGKTSKEYALFGIGKMGKQAYSEMKESGKRIACIIDNNKSLWGTQFDGIPIISLDEFVSAYDAQNVDVVISSMKHIREMVNQLEMVKIKNWKYHIPRFKSFFPEDVLVFESGFNTSDDEDEQNKRVAGHPYFDYVRRECGELYKELPLFNHVEIETYNRCNGTCSFCPVSRGNDTRTECLMSKQLFKKIIEELSDLEYDGILALFSNNEPFLDDRIIDFHKYARNKLPKARMHLYTNGTVLTLDKFIDVMNYLDELIIDNYNKQRRLIPNCKAIKEYCEEHRELIKRVTIIIRNPSEILTTRAGTAPNRKELLLNENAGCFLPFKQFIIRPDGKVSLCCNDALGKNTLGDLTKETMVEVWKGEKYDSVRKSLLKGRQYIESCKYCDFFSQ